MEKKKDLIALIKKYPHIKLAYFFGSRAKGTAGPLADYDFAVYADEKDKTKLFDLKLDLQEKLSALFGTDKVDVVVLNLVEAPELKYNIIKEGLLIYEKEPYALIVEPKIFNEYFDFHYGLVKHGLTKERKR